LFHSIHDKDGEYIASTWAGSHHANAALIAAAPELLIALREALDALNGAPNTVGLHSMIESAISKAERKE